MLINFRYRKLTLLRAYRHGVYLLATLTLLLYLKYLKQRERSESEAAYCRRQA